MMVTTVLDSAAIPFRALAVSSAVTLGYFVGVPTFAEGGINVDKYGTVYGIAVSPQMNESLRQEIGLAFSNITSDPIFIAEVTNLGASVLNGYTYGSSVIMTFINRIISLLTQVLDYSGPSPPIATSPNKSKLALAISLGIILPIFLLVLIVTTFFFYYWRKRSGSQLKLYDLTSLTAYEIGRRSVLESSTIPWNAITDMKEIGSGSYEFHFCFKT